MSTTAMLPSLKGIPARPPRQAHFGIPSIDPVHPLSTLQTPRCRDACKTRSWSVCSTLTRPDFHRQVGISFPNALPNVLILNRNGNTHNPWTRSRTTFTTGLQHQIELAQLPRPRC